MIFRVCSPFFPIRSHSTLPFFFFRSPISFIHFRLWLAYCILRTDILNFGFHWAVVVPHPLPSIVSTARKKLNRKSLMKNMKQIRYFPIFTVCFYFMVFHFVYFWVRDGRCCFFHSLLFWYTFEPPFRNTNINCKLQICGFLGCYFIYLMCNVKPHTHTYTLCSICRYLLSHFVVAG